MSSETIELSGNPGELPDELAMAVERSAKTVAAAKRDGLVYALLLTKDADLILSRLAELKAAKWDVKHVDTMNDAVLRGLAIESQAEEIERLNATIERLQSESAKDGEALDAADAFITNGIALGFIRMPDPDTPDPALLTPGIVYARLSARKAPLGSTQIGEG